MPSSDGRKTIVLVCDGPSDERSLRAIFDRLLVERVDCIALDSIDAFRAYDSPDVGRSFLAWQRVREVATNLGVREVHGFIKGEPAGPQARAARRALTALRDWKKADVVVMVCDHDAQPGRHTGLEQASRHAAWGMAIAIGVANPNREAWVLAGFQPKGESESSLLAEIRNQLGFDPTREPERLRDSAPSELRSTKRVLAHLTNDDHAREDACLAETPWQTLKSNGAECGLVPFIESAASTIEPTWCK